MYVMYLHIVGLRELITSDNNDKSSQIAMH